MHPLRCDLPIWIKTFGGPRDPFHRVLDEFERVGDVVHVRRTIVTKAQLVDRVVVTVGSEAPILEASR